MSSSQGTFIYRTFLARPIVHVATIRRGGFHGSERHDHRARQTVETHYMKQNSRKKSSVSGQYFNSSSAEGKRSHWGSSDLELEELLTKATGRYNDVSRTGRVSATVLNPVLGPAPYTKEQVQPHLLAGTFNTALQLSSSGLSSTAFRSSPPTWTAPSRTVKVAYQADSKTKSQASNSTLALPQYAPRVGRISAQNQSSPLLLSPQVSDLGVTSKGLDSGSGEAWERAAHKLGRLGPTKSMSALSFRTEASVSEVEPAKAYSPSFPAVDTKIQPEPFRLVASGENKSEPCRLVARGRQDNFEPLKVSEHTPEWGLEPPSPFEKLLEKNQSTSHVDEPEGGETKKTPARRRATAKKAGVDGSVDESKPKRKPRAKKIPVAVQPEEKVLGEVNVTNDPVVSTLVSLDLPEERQSFPNESVMVIDSVEKATLVVQQLMGEYKDLVHACDTEVLF